MKRFKIRITNLEIGYLYDVYEEGIAVECEDGRYGVVHIENVRGKTDQVNQ